MKNFDKLTLGSCRCDSVNELDSKIEMLLPKLKL